MIYKNLIRRKARTMLTILGISIGVAAIITLGALAKGLGAGYDDMLSGSKADLVLSQPDAFDISYSSIDESAIDLIINMPEVLRVSGMLEGFTQVENEPFFFVFGYPEDSFVLERFYIIDGFGLNSREAEAMHGNPLILGSAAAEVLDKSTGDTLRITGSVYKVVGIYETGDAFEDSGVIMDLKDAQNLLGRPRQVSLYYIQLKDPENKERFIQRVERQLPGLSISGLDEFAEKQTFDDMLQAYVWVIGGLAIIIGGVGMMNSQLMSIFERTREIGVLRAIGWSRYRILWMILGESLLVSFSGGIVGIAIGYLVLRIISNVTVLMGVSSSVISMDLLTQSIFIVFVLGMVGGVYPAWRAAKLEPIEALRYEGGSTGKKMRRLPIGGMAVQSLWQRSTRTLLSMGAIGLTVGAITTLEGMVRGVSSSMTNMVFGVNAEVMLRQADIADTSLSAIDERFGDKIAALPEVKSISGMVISAVILPEAKSFFMIMGYAPSAFAIQRLKIVEGERLATNHQVLLGRIMAEALKKKVGDTLELSGSRFRVVGIYESDVSWEELGGVLTLRDAQIMVGRPRKVSIYSIKLNDPTKANEIVEKINREYPDIHAALAGQFAEQMPDMQNSQGMLDIISFIAILVGGVGVLNTMLMAVVERTREIGVLRALGWRRRSILSMIVKEALLLGLLGGFLGIIISFGLAYVMSHIPMLGSALIVVWEWDIFVRAILIALLLGMVGGLYPAYRATQLQPVEALRYE
jgi:putative ABC transport system permease protein